MTRVIVVDDHPVVREGLVAAIAGRNGIDVVGAFGSAEEAIAASARLEPDVVVLDIELPQMSGLDAIPHLHGAVVVLTAYESEEDIDRALKAGAKGYLLKGAPLDDIARAIDAAARGESYVDPRLAGRLMSHRKPRLTAREREVLQLVAAGRSNKEIGTRLRISERTAKFHVTAILTKLGAGNRAQAVAIAQERRLL